ncbi:calcium-binding protein [Nocardioides panacis]|uniref:Calcium-binding protein n=1 Tax=Nocardioides panacis TaxID=2849501 RepID=A0A975Y235_9ACTN|nr:calcium-binding protein [Nocardioides panacis]QWZ10145.1 calcium-binding protein [Nocardioides panacis]
MKRLAQFLALALLISALVTPTATALTKHRCHGQRATITGTAGADNIVGTRHHDVIWTGAGNDRVLGNRGNDLICAGSGNDVIDGNSGRDTVYGGTGTDWCVAWSVLEHMFHRQCEVHAGLMEHPSPQRNIQKATPVPRAAVPTKPLAESFAQRAFTDCGTAGTCTVGVAVCDAAHFDYLTERGMRMPTAYTRDGGLLAVSVFLIVIQNGTSSIKFTSTWKAYSAGAPGWYELPPSPPLVNLLIPGLAGSAGYLVAGFQYSGDNGETCQVAAETTYLFRAASGWRNYPGDRILTTQACFL